MSVKLKYLIPLLALFLGSFSAFAQDNTAETTSIEVVEEKAKDMGFNIADEIFGHISDAYEWHLFSVGATEVTVHLPIILYSPTKGFSVFSAKNFKQDGAFVPYEGYEMIGGDKIVAQDGSPVYDFSITKNVLALFGAVILILWLFLTVAKRYKQNGSDKAPSGLQNAVEACIKFIEDEVAKPALGVHARRFMPLLLTIFFFIWIVNLLGMIPGGANVTGNIAVTACLALIAFIVMLFSSKAHYWKHLFNPPGMPFFVKVVLVPIELISLIIKPTALMIRLFANMLAGHIILLCFAMLIFIFASMNVYVGSGFSIVSVALSAFSMLIELLVTAIQAYIFAFLTAIFVGQMFIEEGHDHEEVPVEAS